MHENLLWETVLAELRLNLSGANYQTWFKGKTDIVSVKDSLVEIGCHNAYVRDWLEQRYYQQIKLSLDRLLETDTSLLFSVVTLKSETVGKAKPSRPLAETSLFELGEKNLLTERQNQAGLNPSFTFENFVVGSSNQLAQAVALAITANLGKEFNPLFLHGGVGVGKTHLMQAIGNKLLTTNPDFKIAYCTSEKFTTYMIEEIQPRRTASFRARYRNLDLLLIDDIQFIAGRESTQEEFFHTFNHLYAVSKQIVLTSDRPPAEIKKLEERLKSRFEGGMIADIQNPEVDLREAILLSKARLQAQNIDSQIIRFIAEACSGSVRDLEGCLVRLITRAKMTGEAYSLDLAKKIVADRLLSKKPSDAKKVVSLVANFFDLKTADLKGSSRQAQFVLPRQLTMYLLRKDLQLGFEKIAAELGKKDHTTILYGVDKIEKAVENSTQVQSWVKQLRLQLQG